MSLYHRFSNDLFARVLERLRGAQAVGIATLHFDVRRPAEMVREIRERLALRLAV